MRPHQDADAQGDLPDCPVAGVRAAGYSVFADADLQAPADQSVRVLREVIERD
jgi:hypothetical protein